MGKSVSPEHFCDIPLLQIVGHDYSTPSRLSPDRLNDLQYMPKAYDF